MDRTAKALKSDKLDCLFRLGCSQYASGDFISAIKTLEIARDQFLEEKKYQNYLKCQNLLVPMHTEMENFSEIISIRQELAKILSNHSELDIYRARFHNALGFCYLRQKDYSVAERQFEQALAQTLKLRAYATENKKTEELLRAHIDICYVSYGFSSLYATRGKNLEAIHELKNMDTLLKSLKNFCENDVNTCASTVSLLEQAKEDQESFRFAHNFLQAHLLKTEKKYESAEELFWICYEACQKNYRRKYVSLHILYFLGKNYMAKKDYGQALIFLNLAKKSIDPRVLKKMDRSITEALSKLKEVMKNNYDIVVDLEDKVIVEKDKGLINLKNQFILLDMLKLFVLNAGSVFSKEDLVKKIWKQDYDPRVHDNKIYVTIKRLRELVEPDHKNPKYIFRTKEGYYINKKVSVLLK